MSEAPLSDLYEAKSAMYAAFGNGVVAAHAERLLPDGGRVLDLGCASGGLLALLRERAGHLAGLELSATAAQAAAAIGDEVVCGALEDPDLPFRADSFDVVVLADVIEHLVDPQAAVHRAVGWCRPGGSVVISVPNIAHWQARLTVLRGRWPQDDSGTFDASHLRFFTSERLRELLEAENLEGVLIDPVVPALRNHLPVARLGDRRAAALEARWQVLGRRFPGITGYQLVGVGRRPAT